MLINISVRDLHNDMIKPSKNSGLASVADSVTQKVLINDTILRSFIPPKVRKKTPKSHQICGCEPCINPKDMQIDLNIYITTLVIDLQHNSVGRYTRNILFSTKSAAHYKDKVFTYG